MRKNTVIASTLLIVVLSGCKNRSNQSNTADTLNNSITTTETCGIDYSKPAFIIQGSDTVEKWEYNKDGFLTEHFFATDEEGNPLFERFIYSPQGKMQKRYFSEKTGGQEQVETYTYNEKGLLSLSKASKNNYTKYSYDEQDRLIKKEGVSELK